MCFLKTMERYKHCGNFCVIIFGVISFFTFNYFLLSKFSRKVIISLYQEKFNLKMYTDTHKSTQILMLCTDYF